MAEKKSSSIVKPNRETPFHIDFSWWRQNDQEWRVHLRGLLCAEHEKEFSDIQFDEVVDWVDAETAEVHQVDGLQHILLTHCSQQEEFLNEHTALTEAIFRLFMTNGNTPLNAEEIAERLNRPPTTILRTLSGTRVYNGLLPILE